MNRVRLWQIRSTEKAYLFRTLPPGDPQGQEVWVPRSVIGHVSRNAPVNGVQECVVDVEDWFAEKHDL